MSDLIENDRRIIFPSQRVQASVVGAEAAALAFTELDAAIPFIVWLHRDAIIKRLDAELDAEADDRSALSHEARQKAEAEVMGDLLAVERDESSLVWAALEQRLPVEHRSDINPVALLAVQMVTAVRTNGSTGSSPMQAYDVIGSLGR